MKQLKVKTVLKTRDVDTRHLDTQNAVRAVGQFHPVVEDEPHDLAEAQGYNGQVVATHPQGRVTDDAAGNPGKQGRKGQADPE